MSLEVLLFGGMLLGVLLGCLLPNRWLPPLPNDKLLHALAFAALTALAPRGPTLAACLGLFLLGWLIECLQALVPDRGFSWGDLAANGAGIAGAALALELLR
ncbi:hypothetical protein [Massilia endophytica]|uniref:hypothetical protein n=1 Tax=Massilia endophytica TaxID=2899220 RepID=UPI001E60EBA1|nr:hypothetical protein [Massilia endophytica]UGQ45478.1 hypothetical protein LSQ66_17035 [Massilia endophytica]